MNSEYVAFIKDARAGKLRPSRTVAGHGLGYIPPTLAFPHLRNQPNQLAASLPLPSHFDLRTQGRVTPVKDQGQCGACWAFATYGSAESVLMPGESRDYSENNMKNLSGFDYTPCQGGNFQMSAAYLTRWSGPVNESDDPYQPTNTNTSPANSPTQKHQQEIIFIPGRGGPADNDQIKAAVMNYGGVSVGMEMDESTLYLNSATGAYYFNDWNASGTNHTVTVVGWDDNYSKSNFTQTPPGDGAFLVKNSWGTNWGLSGYFWVSYYSLQFANGYSTVFAGAQPLAIYSHEYEYDPLGWVSSMGWSNSTTFTFANVFNATEAGYLDAVSTYLATNNSSYSVQIYKGGSGDPTGGTLEFSDSGTIPLAGYHTFTVNPVHVISGDVFSVVMTLTTPGYPWPAPYETAYSGYSSNATGWLGQSFYYNGTNWYDVYFWDKHANYALKAFTSAESTPPTDTPTFQPAAGAYTTPQNVSILAPSGATVHYTLDGSTPTMFSAVYTSPIAVSINVTIKAIALSPGQSTSAIGVATYSVALPIAAAPIVEPGGGFYGASQWITLKPVTANSLAYFTLDGTIPTSSSSRYTGPIPINASATINTIAAGPGIAPSPVASATFMLIPAPMVLAGLATSSGPGSATLHAQIDTQGGSGQAWFLWGTAPGALTHSTPRTNLAASIGPQPFSAVLSVLRAQPLSYGTSSPKSTRIYFQPVAITIGGISYGAVQSITVN